MSADIILFVPRSNPKADRAFWIGREPTPIEQALPCVFGFASPDQLVTIGATHDEFHKPDGPA